MVQQHGYIVSRRLIVGPAGDVDFGFCPGIKSPIIGTNEKIFSRAIRYGLKTWSAACVVQPGEFADYVPTLPRRWFVRSLHWFDEMSALLTRWTR